MRYILPLFVTLFATLCLTACSANPRVTLVTEKGNIVIEVFEDKAPISAADFLYHVDNDLYKDQGFYRVVRPDNDPRGMGMALIQGGLLTMTPVTPPLAHETTQMTGLTHKDGAVSIARDAPGTGSAAFFFITIGDNSFLDYGGARNPDGQGYAVFGRVVKGMEIVRAIQAMPSGGPSADEVTAGQFLPEPVKITQAKR